MNPWAAAIIIFLALICALLLATILLQLEDMQTTLRLMDVACY